eukprot:366245-Chlamydomonas_euryale.AAC.26
MAVSHGIIEGVPAFAAQPGMRLGRSALHTIWHGMIGARAASHGVSRAGAQSHGQQPAMLPSEYQFIRFWGCVGTRFEGWWQHYGASQLPGCAVVCRVRARQRATHRNIRATSTAGMATCRRQRPQILLHPAALCSDPTPGISTSPVSPLPHPPPVPHNLPPYHRQQESMRMLAHWCDTLHPNTLSRSHLVRMEEQRLLLHAVRQLALGALSVPRCTQIKMDRSTAKPPSAPQILQADAPG